MPIWKKPFDLSLLNASNHGTAARHLGIEIIEMGDDFVRGRVPVDHRTKQPFGLLHGGVSGVGVDINANHLRSARSGWVTGQARPVHLGRSTQVWHIDLVNEADELICVSRLTMAILAPR